MHLPHVKPFIVVVAFLAGTAFAAEPAPPAKPTTVAHPAAALSPNLFGSESALAGRLVEMHQFAEAVKNAQAARQVAGSGSQVQLAGAPVGAGHAGDSGLQSGSSPAPGPAYSPSSNGAFLDCVRQRESNGQYGVKTNPAYRGAYQFSFSTWDNTAAHAGRPDLIGVDPADASPADQDAMAQELLAWQGTGPWAGGNYSC